CGRSPDMHHSDPMQNPMAPSGAAPAPAAAPESWQKSLLRQYFQVQLVCNPLLCALATLGLGSSDAFGHSFAIALVVAAVGSSVCFVPIALLLALEQRA